MLAGMIFRKEPFFYGHDNYDQLVKICKAGACYRRRPMAGVTQILRGFARSLGRLQYRLKQAVVSHYAVMPSPCYVQVLGTDSFYAYLNKYGLELDPQLEALVGR